MIGQAAVAAGNAGTVEAAVTVLRAGGNAYDAAVAAGFAAAVTEPALTSLGGGGFLLAAPVDAEPVVFDFFVDAPGLGLPAGATPAAFVPVTIRFPGADQVFHAGWGSVAVPGCLDGFLEVHRSLGVLPLVDVVAPARDLALGGAIVDAVQARLLTLLVDILTLTPEGRRMFLPRGEFVRPGERIRNEELGAFLGDVAAGRIRGFGDPALAATIERSVCSRGGLVTARDLSSYAAVRREPLPSSTVRHFSSSFPRWSSRAAAFDPR